MKLLPKPTYTVVKITRKADKNFLWTYCHSPLSCQFTPQSLSSTSDHYFNQCGLNRLDGDKDGVPCEVLYD